MTLPTLFAFDLDGTVTTEEILPAIARKAGLFQEISRLTRMTLDGELDFEASFRKRFAMLRHVPLETVREVTASIPLDPDIRAFIAENTDRCAIVTGNLDRWIEPMVEKLGCAVWCSRSTFHNGQLFLDSILDKGEAVRNMAGSRNRVIAIGDAANDIPMFEAADMGIAYGGIRNPVPGLLAAANRAEYDGRSLCALLRRL